MSFTKRKIGEKPQQKKISKKKLASPFPQFSRGSKKPHKKSFFVGMILIIIGFFVVGNTILSAFNVTEKWSFRTQTTHA